MTKYQKGTIINGIVSGITEYGIFVKLDEKYSGLIHISEISHKYVKDPNAFANIDDQIRVEILDIDEKNDHMKLSIKNISYKGDIYDKRKRIIETPLGFSTLASKLPFWIDESLKSKKNKENSIDK